jgi:hypothetical protein
MIPDLKSSSELLWVNVKQKGKKIYLSAVHTDQIQCKDFSCIDELEGTLSVIDIDNNTVVMGLGGDLNIPDIDWKSHNVKPWAKHESDLDENNKLLSCIDKFGLAQLMNLHI